MQLRVSLRLETPADAEAIGGVVEAAFERRAEADLVDALRSAGALTLSAVAVTRTRVVGYAGYSVAEVVSGGEATPVLALAPVAVAPGFQRRGAGIAVVRWSLDRCRELGYGVVFVLGDPAYYTRFGFVPAVERGVHCPFPAPPEAFRLVELRPGAADGLRGTLRYRPEFDRV